MSDVTLHIDENAEHDELESLRDNLLNVDGVMAAAYQDETPHLMVIEYDPELVESVRFLEIAKGQGLHGQLVGM
jgi:hypothetical protein